MKERFLHIRGLTKRYGGVLALDNVSLDILPGETHSIIGENGAGKSTLLRILAGAVPCDGGTVSFRDRDITNADPNHLFSLGVSVAFQETSLFENLTVTENLFLGSLYRYKKLGIDWKHAGEETKKILTDFGLHTVEPSNLVEDISPENRQIIEILKAVKDSPALLCLDEPTSALTFDSIQLLYKLLDRLKNEGATIIYVSHHLEEIIRISDRITVLRDGKKIDTISGTGVTKPVLHELMVGREIKENRERKETIAAGRTPILACDHISDGGKVADVSLSVYKGEILGITGLVGSGRSELAWLLAGLAKSTSGSITYRGEDCTKNTADRAMRKGIVYLPEERRQMGVFLDQDLVVNTTISKLEKVKQGPFLRFGIEKRLSREMMEKVGVKYQTQSQTAFSLSGGNQQKLLLGKCLFTDPGLLILDEPTRGIDVGSKEEIYAFIHMLSAGGLTVVVISSEIEEICRLCSRVLVMSDGRISGEFKGEEIDEYSITACYLKAHE